MPATTEAPAAVLSEDDALRLAGDISRAADVLSDLMERAHGHGLTVRVSQSLRHAARIHVTIIDSWGVL